MTPSRPCESRTRRRGSCKRAAVSMGSCVTRGRGRDRDRDVGPCAASDVGGSPATPRPPPPRRSTGLPAPGFPSLGNRNAREQASGRSNSSLMRKKDKNIICIADVIPAVIFSLFTVCAKKETSGSRRQRNELDFNSRFRTSIKGTQKSTGFRHKNPFSGYHYIYKS